MAAKKKSVKKTSKGKK